jgi:hypothetical protein
MRRTRYDPSVHSSHLRRHLSSRSPWEPIRPVPIRRQHNRIEAGLRNSGAADRAVRPTHLAAKRSVGDDAVRL